MVGTGRGNGRVPRIGGGWPPPSLFEQPTGDLHFLIGELPLQGCRDGRDRFAPDRQRLASPLHAGVEVPLQAWIQVGEVGSGVRSAALAALERAAKRRLRRSEPCPQIEYMLELDPSFLPGANVDAPRGVRQGDESAQTVPPPGLIANDATVLPHQVAERPLEGTG